MSTKPKYITNYKRPLPKGSVVGVVDTNMTGIVISDELSRIKVQEGSGIFYWHADPSFIHVLSIPKPKKRKKKVERLTKGDLETLEDVKSYLREHGCGLMANVVEKAARIGGKK